MAWDITVSGGDLETVTGLVGLGLDPSSAWSIRDLAGNYFGSWQPTGSVEEYAVDHTAPELMLIERFDPAEEWTQADSLTFRVHFSEPVAGVDAGKFAVWGTDAAVTAVAAVVEDGFEPDSAFDVTGVNDGSDFTGKVVFLWCSLQSANGLASTGQTMARGIAISSSSRRAWSWVSQDAAGTAVVYGGNVDNVCLSVYDPADGSKDVFVHISAVERSGLGQLVEGQRVSFDVTIERGKSAATNLKAA